MTKLESIKKPLAFSEWARVFRFFFEGVDLRFYLVSPQHILALVSRVSSPRFTLLSSALAIVVISGCGLMTKPKTKIVQVEPSVREFLSLSNMENAPLEIIQASQAIVKITSEDGSSGSGSFVSKEGMLLTNNHVLGSKVCAKTGCFVRLSWNYAAGSGESFESKYVFAIPKAVSTHLDAAYLQIFNLDPNTLKPVDKLSVSCALEFNSETPESLKGQTVYIVGHPNSGLKKWSKGSVIDSYGNWFQSDAFSLPGNSGSPVLNSNGKIIGIHHSGTTKSEANITRSGYRSTATGTASAPLLDLLAKVDKVELSTLGALKDVAQATTKEGFFESSVVFLNSHVGELTLEDPSTVSGVLSKVHPSVLIAEEIDRKLLVSNEESELDTDALETLGFQVIDWLNCNQLESIDDFKLCPTVADRQKWIERVDRLADKLASMNRESNVILRADLAYALSATQAEGNDSANKIIKKYSKDQLNFKTVSNLLAYADSSNLPKIGEADVKSYIMNFQSFPNYEFHYREIMRGLSSLYRLKFISADELSSKVDFIFKDPKTALNERIYAERIAFSAGIL